MNFFNRLRKRRHSVWYHISSIFCRLSLPFFQKIGLNVTVNHYYSPIPDIRKTKSLYEKNSSRNSEITGICFDLNTHVQFVDTLEKYIKEFENSVLSEIVDNTSFRSVDAEILFSIIRYNKPEKIVEIGGGISSKIISAAIEINEREGQKCTYIMY